MKNSIVFTLIFLFSKHLYAAAPDWGQDTNCNSFFGKNKEWQHIGSNYLNFYKEASEELSKQLSLFKVLDHPKLKKCVKDNYGFEIPFKILNKKKFATYRLAEEHKGFSCRFKEEDRFIEGDDYFSHYNEAWDCFNINFGDKRSCPGYWIDRNEVLGQYSSRLEGLGRVSFKHYCAKNVLEAYTKHYKDKSQSKDAKECFNQTTINLSDPDFENKKKKCTTIFENINYANFIATEYLKFNENGFSDEQRDLSAEVPSIQRLGLGVKKVDGELELAYDQAVGEIESLYTGPEYISGKVKPYTNKDLVNDMVTLSNFDDNVYDQYKNKMKALQVATDAANKKMALTENIVINGLDKIADCMDSSNINDLVKDSFDDPCSTSFGLDALANASIVDINEVVENINADYASDLAKEANILSFEKNLENLLNYATPDVLELLKDEARFCKSIGFVQGCLKQSGCNQNINNHIKNILDTNNGPYVDSEWINGSSVRYSKNQAKGTKIYDSHLCESSNELKDDYKKIFKQYKNDNRLSAKTLNPFEIVETAAQRIKNFNDFRENINKACTKIVEGSDSESIEKIGAGKTISDEYLKFVNDNKDDFHVVGLLNALTADQRSVGSKFMDWVKSWTKNADNSHQSVPNTLGLCKFKVDGDRKRLIDLPELTADDFTNFKNQINGDLLKQLGSNSYLENPQASHDLLGLEISAGQCKGNVNSYLPIFHALRSHPASLAEYLRGEVNSAQKILKLKAVCQSIRCFNDYEEHKNDNVGYLKFIASSVRSITPKQAVAVKASARLIEEISDLAILSNKVQSAQGNFGDYVTLFYNGDIKNQDDLLNAIIDADKNLKFAEKYYNDFFKNLFKDLAMDMGETYILGNILESDKFKVALENNNLVKKLFPTADPILQQSLLKNYMGQFKNLAETIYSGKEVSDFAVKAITLEVSRQFMLKKEDFKRIINDSELNDDQKKEAIDKVLTKFKRAEDYGNLAIEQTKELVIEGEVDLKNIGESVMKTESKLLKKK
jgi:hypothetical protein